MYTIRNYGEMIADSARMDAYVRALRQTVRPGSVVLDIGTGTGIFALLACRFGARRVFAIEPSDAICVAQEIAAANGCADRIEFFQALSTQVTLPEPADVIVSDLRGILPLYQRHLVAMADARRRLLAPGGTMIPRSDTLWVAVIEATDLHDRAAAAWKENGFELDMDAARRLAANEWRRATVRAEQIAAGPECCGTLDYSAVDQPDFTAVVHLRAAKAATAHGLCVWFDATLAEGVHFSNAPGKPSLIYGSAFFPWPRPVDLAADDAVTLKLSAHLVGEDYVWSWDTRIADRAGAERVKADFRQSEFFGAPLSPAKLRKRAASHVPELNEEGRIDRLILALMNDGKSLGDIARELSAQFPERFARWQDALTRVGELSVRYSR
jgi:type I protein arginine methyltransferase